MTLIFDFDGTIADSFHIIFESYNEVAQKLNCKKVTNKDIEKIRNLHTKDMFKQLNIAEHKIPLFYSTTLTQYKEKIKDLKAIPNIKEAIQALKNEGYNLHILTSNTTENVELFLENNELNSFFGKIVSGGSDILDKKFYIKKFIESNKLNTEKTVYVGDEARDIEAAKKSNIKIIAVSWGYNSKEKLAEYKPDFLIDSPDELLPIAQNLANLQ